MFQAGFESGSLSIQHMKISPGSPAMLQFVFFCVLQEVSLVERAKKNHPMLDAECY
jgi:hypothetical protein